jgi:hypothetical protein
MRTALLLALTQLLALPAVAQVNVLLYGYFTREDYIRVERCNSGSESGEYIILQKFLHPEEYRLPVQGHYRRGYVDEMHAHGGGRDVRLVFRGSNEIYVGLDGAPPQMRVTKLPAPAVRHSYRGYYTKSNYARIETVSDGRNSFESLLLQEFPSVIQERFGVTSHTQSGTNPRHESFEAGKGSRRYRLEIEHSRPKRATFTAPGLGPVRYVLLD